VEVVARRSLWGTRLRALQARKRLQRRKRSAVRQQVLAVLNTVAASHLKERRAAAVVGLRRVGASRQEPRQNALLPKRARDPHLTAHPPISRPAPNRTRYYATNG
jgi:hypothetical protein